jgi:hypothetical protein
MALNNETIHVDTDDHEAVSNWMKEVTGDCGGWYIAGPNPWSLGSIGIVFCSDFPLDREPFKILIKLKWS